MKGFVLPQEEPAGAIWSGYLASLPSVTQGREEEIAKVSSAFAMEQMKYTTALPLQFARATRSGETS